MRSNVSLCLPAILTVLFASPAAFADSVDEFIQAQMQKRQIAGLSLAIIERGKIVKAKGYGVADRESRMPVTPETLFQAGSISKSVAAMGALHLVEQHKLSLDEDINRYLTSWKVPENEFTRRQKVTLRAILSHTAGFTVHGFPGYATNQRIPSLTQVLNGERPANTPPIRVDILPGSQWRYSGGGYTVLQQAVQDVTGQRFDLYMQQAVLGPAGMNSSAFTQPLSSEKMRSTASGYLSSSQPVGGRWHVYPEMAAAGLWTTPSDLARFAISIQQSLVGKAHPVLSQEMTRQMLTNVKDNDGLGVFLQGSGSTLRFLHNGRDEGFDAMLLAYAETGQGAVIMINANDNSPMVSQILETIAKEYHWPDYPFTPSFSAIKDPEPKVTAQIKAVWQGLAQDHYDRSLFTGPVADAIEAQQKQGVAAFLRNYGDLEKIELVERKDEGGSRLYRHRITYQKGKCLVLCVFNRENKIATFTLKPEQ